MSNLLYPKLALVNIRKHAKLYLPYIISASVTIAMFYVMGEITFNEGITKMYGAEYLSTVLVMGDIVIGLFSLIFLLYTNSFLMKQRKRELGLYNVLGMEKKHISKIMFFETFFVSLISLASGLGFGILFDKLASLFLCNLMMMKVSLGFYISVRSIVITSIVFVGIFFISFISNVVRVRRSNTINLLHSASFGEKEPRAKIVLAVLGVIFLAIGYTTAIVVKSPIEALTLFFFAVIAVIAGTYCLFMAGSIAVLKLLRKNKNYYYNSKHFTSLSGMIYRMKQNAVGLANICILSTMVLVMISTTVAMYMGTEDALHYRYPLDIDAEIRATDVDYKYSPESMEKEETELLNSINEALRKSGRTASDAIHYEYLAFATVREGNTYSANGYNYSAVSGIHEFCFITADEYRHITGETVSLGKNEIVTCSNGEQLGDTVSLLGTTYTVKGRLESFPSISNFSTLVLNVHYTIVPDKETLYNIYEQQLEEYGESASNICFEAKFNIDGTDEQKISCTDLIRKEADKALKVTECPVSLSVDCRQQNKSEFYSMYGSFFFLGIVLGALFLMVTVMIIYYKQISEGYDDKKRFEIMQQVGMSKTEVRKTIRSQVLTVFFLPLVTAVIHLAFSFPIISRLLIVFNLTNTGIFAVALVLTAVVFALIYAAVYSVTAKAYYKIVD